MHRKILCRLILGGIYFSPLYGMDEDIDAVNLTNKKETQRKTAHRKVSARKKGQFHTRKIDQLEDEDKRYVLCVIDVYDRLTDGIKTINKAFSMLNEEYNFPLNKKEKITTISAWFLEKLRQEDYQQFFDETAQLLKVYGFKGKETYPDKKNDVESREEFRKILFDIACEELKKEKILNPYPVRGLPRAKPFHLCSIKGANNMEENDSPLVILRKHNKNTDNVMCNSHDVSSRKKDRGLIGEEYYSNVLKNSSIDIFNPSGLTYCLHIEEMKKRNEKSCNSGSSENQITTEYMIVDDLFYTIQPNDTGFNW